MKHKPYNWGGNYIRLDGAVTVVPPLQKLLLCVRISDRISGYQIGDEFISFVEYSRRKQLGGNIKGAVPVKTSRAIFALDTWLGRNAPWQHACNGYIGFYRIPEISPLFWRKGNKYEMEAFHLVYLPKPSLFETAGFDKTLPGIYLAQSYLAQDSSKNWAIHNPGYRWGTTGDFCIPPIWSCVPDISVEFWLPLPDLKHPFSFR